MYYHFKVYKEKVGYCAKCIEIEGCQSQGDTMEELKTNLAEVLNLCIDEPADSDYMIPDPDYSLKGKNIIEIKVNPRIAFSNCLRQLRLKHNYTKKQIAERMGYKYIWGYKKLE